MPASVVNCQVYASPTSADDAEGIADLTRIHRGAEQADRRQQAPKKAHRQTTRLSFAAVTI